MRTSKSVSFPTPAKALSGNSGASLRTMRFTIPLVALGLLATSLAQAAITIDTVIVGDPGNSDKASTSLGGVSYTYRISTFEVTNAQYASFLNATAVASDTHGLWNIDMGSDDRGGISRSGTAGSYSYTTRSNMGNKPVNFVNFWDAARFTNWMTTGDTETGVYNLGNVTSPVNTSITRDATTWNNGGVAIASDDEWFKAAYYDPTLNSGSGGYWNYPTMSNTAPTSATADATGNISNPGTNIANFSNGADWNSQDGNVTTVGSAGAGSASYYGTYDQGGNVWEWTEGIHTNNINRRLAGVGYGSASGGMVSTQIFGAGDAAAVHHPDKGFRVTSLQVIPEPGTAGLCAMALALALLRRRTRRQS